MLNAITLFNQITIKSKPRHLVVHLTTRFCNIGFMQCFRVTFTSLNKNTFQYFWLNDSGVTKHCETTMIPWFLQRYHLNVINLSSKHSDLKLVGFSGSAKRSLQPTVARRVLSNVARLQKNMFESVLWAYHSPPWQLLCMASAWAEEILRLLWWWRSFDKNVRLRKLIQMIQRCFIYEQMSSWWRYDIYIYIYIHYSFRSLRCLHV